MEGTVDSLVERALAVLDEQEKRAELCFMKTKCIMRNAARATVMGADLPRDVKLLRAVLAYLTSVDLAFCPLTQKYDTAHMQAAGLVLLAALREFVEAAR